VRPPVTNLAAPPQASQSFSTSLHAEQKMVSTFFHACTDYHPLLSKRNDYFQPDVPHELPPSFGSLSHQGGRARSDSLAPAVIRDVISVVVPCFTESARNLRHTLYDLWIMQEFMHKHRTFFEFHICLILDGWSKAPPSLQAYIHALFESEDETKLAKFKQYARELEKDEHAQQQAAYTNATASRAPYANATSNSSSSSDDSSDSSDSSDDEHEQKKDVKFAPSATGGAAGAPSTSIFSSNASATVADEDMLNFPESASFSDMLASSFHSAGKSTGTWEKYISNWSTDSDLNPPTQPETLIIQKWCTSADGHKTVAAIPIFSETDIVQSKTVQEDPEEVRRKRSAALKLTVIIKRDNRRKHNSHEWSAIIPPSLDTRVEDRNLYSCGQTCLLNMCAFVLFCLPQVFARLRTCVHDAPPCKFLLSFRRAACLHDGCGYAVSSELRPLTRPTRASKSVHCRVLRSTARDDTQATE
jgi:hypothetical protein